MITNLKKLDEIFIKKYVCFIIDKATKATKIGTPKVFEDLFTELLDICSIENIHDFSNEYSYRNKTFGIDVDIDMIKNALNEKYEDKIENKVITKEQIEIILLLTTMPPNIIEELVIKIDDFDKTLKKFNNDKKIYYEEIKEIYSDNTLSKYKRKFLKEDKSKDKLINYRMDEVYENFRKNDLVDEYVISLDIYMCPYCNCDDIAIKDGKNRFKSKYQLDHFYDKSKYYYFAISIYNLIPVCQKCNHVKGIEKLNKNPYLETPETNFSIFIDNDIVISTTKDNLYDINKLEVAERYNTKYSIVKNEIIEIKNIVHKYNNSYFKLLENMDFSTFEIEYWKKKALRDGLILEENFNKARLSKVKSDIVKIGLGEDEYKRLMDLD